MTHDLELINVCKTYTGGQRAVIDFSLQAKRGEFISIIGPSGCGKTTTLRMVAGFEELSSGRILVRGRDISRLPPEARPTSTIFQNFALFPHLTVRENISFGLTVRGVDPAKLRGRVDRMIDLFALGEVADRRGSSLSGGQRQRVALARGLAVQPDILLLDEPLGALDANLRKSIQHELKLLQREVGITFVFVTHAQNEALVLSDRIVVMSHGVVEQIAAPFDLYTKPKTEFVARFMGRNALFHGTVEGVNGRLVLLDTGAGAFQGTMDEDSSIRPGQRALLVVPSEAFDINAREGADPSSTGGSLAARVLSRSYCGQVVRLSLDVGGGKTVSLERHVGIADSLPDASEFILSWPTNEARVIATTSAA